MRFHLSIVLGIVLSVGAIHFLASCETAREEPTTPIQAAIESAILIDDPAQTRAAP